jgi:hypothetical protein
MRFSVLALVLGVSACGGDSNVNSDFGKLCSKNEDCSSNLCIFDSDTAGSSNAGGVCTVSCTSSTQCPSGTRCEPLDSSPAMVCFRQSPCTASTDPVAPNVCGHDPFLSLPLALHCRDAQQVPPGCNMWVQGEYCCPGPGATTGGSTSGSAGTSGPACLTSTACEISADCPAGQLCNQQLFLCFHQDASCVGAACGSSGDCPPVETCDGASRTCH